jgi:ribose/xylose/arabinose/galactoside ABC-type transport system permease subunit
MAHPAPDIRHRSSQRRWLAAFSAQESGLILVIAAMMLGLTLRAGTIDRSEREELPPSAVVTQLGDEIRVSSEGRTRVYLASAGYEVQETGGAKALRHTYQVNKFLNASNLVGVANYASFIAIMAVAMAGIIIMGGIDLSIGSIYALAAMVGALALHGPDGDGAERWRAMSALLAIPLGLLVCCGVGAACGAVNGIATVGLAVHPFIITLGGMAVYRGVAFVLTNGQSVGDFPASFRTGFKATILGQQPVPLLLMLAVGFAGAFVLSRTVFGRRTYAVGGNETAARYAGVPVGRIKILWYVLGGVLAGLAAALMLGYFGAASTDAGKGYELRVIAAAVVGGCSLSGGRGSAIGAMLGALVIQLIENGIVVLGVDSNYTEIVIGLAIVLAVVVDQAKHRLTARVR